MFGAGEGPARFCLIALFHLWAPQEPPETLLKSISFSTSPRERPKVPKVSPKAPKSSQNDLKKRPRDVKIRRPLVGVLDPVGRFPPPYPPPVDPFSDKSEKTRGKPYVLHTSAKNLAPLGSARRVPQGCISEFSNPLPPETAIFDVFLSLTAQICPNSRTLCLPRRNL